MPLLRGEVRRVRDAAITAHDGRQWSLHTSHWSFLLLIHGSGGPELYDVLAELLVALGAEGEAHLHVVMRLSQGIPPDNLRAALWNAKPRGLRIDGP